jgi:hypothetical protein
LVNNQCIEKDSLCEEYDTITQQGCIKCKNDYVIYNGKCILPERCLQYTPGKECTKCENGSGLEDGVCKLADHSSLAGSIATMDVLVRTMVQKANVPLADAIRMASETPARLMGVLDRTGTLQRGKDADVIIMDRNLAVRAVWTLGNLVEESNTLY